MVELVLESSQLTGLGRHVGTQRFTVVNQIQAVFRVLASLRRVDPEGMELRRLHLKTSRRRRYSVPAPNSVWHIDGNHKLIRIERLWRDVFDQVTDLFYTTFRRLENEGWLNPDQDVDLFALHWSYMPQIQRNLQEFQSAWNSHSLRSAGNRTPLQLWSNHERDDPNLIDIDDEVREDLEGQQAEGVHVPELDLPRGLTEEELATLPNPDVPFSDALSVYMETVLAIKQMLGES
ncbi:uncharacterized protein LOC125278820 [Megalobrama amblycephala]|uniref:uncharacterized protein LOC125278820 n=1 Tax=Megalobrama amblycephala TaxID=75352 RepID=UPI002013D16F|nr:uncharacterized protein LOC125278820 [Megalobrama amblycephala]